MDPRAGARRGARLVLVAGRARWSARPTPHAPTTCHWLIGGDRSSISFAHQPLTLGLVDADPGPAPGAPAGLPLGAADRRGRLIVAGADASRAHARRRFLAALGGTPSTPRRCSATASMRIYGRTAAATTSGSRETDARCASPGWLADWSVHRRPRRRPRGADQRRGSVSGAPHATGIAPRPRRRPRPGHGPRAAIAVLGAGALTTRWWRAQRAGGAARGAVADLHVRHAGPGGDGDGRSAGGHRRLRRSPHAIEYFGIVHTSLRTTRRRCPRGQGGAHAVASDRALAAYFAAVATFDPPHRDAVARADLRVRGAVPRGVAHPLRRVRVEAAPARGRGDARDRPGRVITPAARRSRRARRAPGRSRRRSPAPRRRGRARSGAGRGRRSPTTIAVTGSSASSTAKRRTGMRRSTCWSIAVADRDRQQPDDEAQRRAAGRWRTPARCPARRPASARAAPISRPTREAGHAPVEVGDAAAEDDVRRPTSPTRRG